MGKKIRNTLETFITKARVSHGDRYDYSAAEFKTMRTKVEIRCRDHGSFWQEPLNHVNGAGCPACSGCKRTTKEDFIRRAHAAHGEKYDYSHIVYNGVDDKVEIVCPEHGPFWQRASDHVNGHGCQQCGIEKCASSSRRSLAEFIRRARQYHGDRFDYSRSVYINSTTPIEIVCPEHGSFWQAPYGHITRYGCAACSGLAPITNEEFLRRAIEVHGDRYDYSQTTYSSWREKVFVGCTVHGPFRTLPKDHISKRCGCPQCAKEATASIGEIDLAGWLAQEGFEIERNNREVLGGFEIDIFLPHHRLGIEYHGAYWHSEETLPHARVHEAKANAAEKKGIHLMTVWDFDWQHRKAFIQSHIMHRLGCNSASRVDARKCEIIPIGNKEANHFYDMNHIQGPAWRQMANYALKDGERLVACMSFTQASSRRGKTGSGEWELIRFATDGIVRGGASRLFYAFTRDRHPETVWSYSDRQHFSGDLYVRLGFLRDGMLPADYRVYHQASGKLWHKSAWQRCNIKSRLAEIGVDEDFDPNTDLRTERDMQRITRCLRIMDAGKIRWRWENKEAAQAASLIEISVVTGL